MLFTSAPLLGAFPGSLRFLFFFSLPNLTRLSFLDTCEPPLPQILRAGIRFHFSLGASPNLPLEVEERNATCLISNILNQ